MRPFCAAVDWGTSSFRLWLLAPDGSVIAERRGPDGMMSAREIGFEAVLDGYLAEVGAALDLPVVICGMAGAKQGWKEAPYLDAPAELASLPSRAVNVDAVARDVRILPGIAQRDPAHPDVMRGEETQLLGLVAEGIASALVCLPGTHSKWVALRDGRVENFSTFMTGEIFAALSTHTILKLNAEGDFGPTDSAFLSGVREAAASPATVANQLFAIRAGSLLGFPPRGAAGISGALIGLEIAGALARHGSGGEVILGSAGRLGELYHAALQEAGFSVRSVDADAAVRAGLLHAALSIWG